jgi:putative Mn2+ efflux pump MntP
MWNFRFFFNSILFGVGLAMDAFSVSMANGLNEPKMKRNRMGLIAGVFAVFQFLMPMLGWLCVTLIASIFSIFEKFIPWIALALLCFIGIKMIIDSVKCKKEEECNCPKKVGLLGLLVQGIATSIDALSVGFTIAEYDILPALVCALIIATVTFAICFAGVYIGGKVGAKFSDKASIFGGAILIIIGIEIFITGIL